MREPSVGAAVRRVRSSFASPGFWVRWTHLPITEIDLPARDVIEFLAPGVEAGTTPEAPLTERGDRRVVLEADRGIALQSGVSVLNALTKGSATRLAAAALTECFMSCSQFLQSRSDRPATSRHSVLQRHSIGAACVLAMLVAATLVSTSSPAAGEPKREYTYEKDPIRVGNTALKEGRLADARTSFEEAVTYEYEVPKAKLGLAEVAVLEGRNVEAERLCREALDANKQENGNASFAEAHARLGLLLIQSDRWPEGEEEIRLAFRQKQGLWLANYGMARLALHENDLPKAKEFLDRGKNKKGRAEGEDLYHHALALYLLGEGDDKAAEIEALKAFSMSPTNAEIGALVGHIYELRGVPALAISAYEKMLKNPEVKPSAEFMRRIGNLYEENQRYTDARDSYLQAVDIDSTYLPALKDLANLLYLADQYDTAAKIYLRYVARDPGDADAQTRLAESCIELGLFEQAFDHAAAAKAIDDTRVDTRLAFARSGIRSKDKAIRAEAASAYQSLPDSAAWKPEDRVLLASQLVEMSDLSGARKNLNLALAADSSFAEAHFQLGLLSMKSAKPDSAVLDFKQAIRLSPQNALYYLNLGVAYSQAKQVDKGIGAFRKAISLDDRQTVGHLLLGQALASIDSLWTAQAEYARALELEPKNARALRGLGFCYLRQENYPEAVRCYQSATESEPGSVDSWVGLGQSYLGLSEWASAERALMKARSIDPKNPGLLRCLDILNRARGTGSGG